jgi:putative addiction module killer protein
MRYTSCMIQIRQTEGFARWHGAIRDVQLRARIADRIDRLAEGNPGDVAPVGEGVSELRLHFGPGYRIYFVQRGELVVVLLCGGDKGTQRRDIETAKKLARELENE